MIALIAGFDAVARELELPRPSVLVSIFAVSAKVKTSKFGQKPEAVEKVRVETFHDARDIAVDTWQADSIEALRVWAGRLKETLES